MRTTSARCGGLLRRAGSFIAAVLGLVLLVNGCASGELDISCGEFLERTPEEQEALVQAYTDKLVEEGEASPFSDDASENLEPLHSHCATNEDDKLSELQPIL